MYKYCVLTGMQSKLFDMKQTKMIDIGPKALTLSDFSREQEDVRK